MRLLLVAFIAVAFIVTPNHDAIAQRSEMPIPNLAVKGGDGKGMAQVDSFYSNNSNAVVLFNFDGVPAPFFLQIQHGMFRSFKRVYFQDIDCTRDVYITEPSDQFGPDILFQTLFAITGPDMVTEAYRVFRSTSPTAPITISSHREQTEDSTFLGRCTPGFSWVYALAPAEGILPNPLDGFHDPLVRTPKEC